MGILLLDFLPEYWLVSLCIDDACEEAKHRFA